MKTLSTEYRRQLERTVVEARDIAEAGAKVALEALAVQHHEPYGHMDGAQRTLRRRLRAHARQLGDRPDARSGGHGIDHLVHECAYEHWHGMLFARFLAENHLLIEPEMGVAITLHECEELAKEEGIDKWALAARFAHSMLPQVFRPDHPVFEVQFAREHRLKLEGLIEGLPLDVFTATDSLGWVYQFWQTKKKDEVNRSEVKIGANELPAVTQLFTEPYMVQFLLHNSLGAWWVGRYPDKTCPVDLAYLRRAEDGAPASGAFEDWPDTLSEFRLLDPCCGSGHFLVAAFLMLTPMRMAVEGLDVNEAVDVVLRENIHGLELDHRCVAIAAFALALEAWRYPDAGGYRTLPKLNLAWCGQPVAGKKEQWLALGEGDPRLEAGMAALYDTFRDAPTLGSLIDPAQSVTEDILTAGFLDLEPLLERALAERAGEEEWEETAIAAQGLVGAARLLSSHYHLVVTNVPYLGRGKQHHALMKFCERRYPKAKADLATCFVERCLELCTNGGVSALVTPQIWMFLGGYKALREWLLQAISWLAVVRLGPGAFETISGEVVNAALFLLEYREPNADRTIAALDVSGVSGVNEKAQQLQTMPVTLLQQEGQRRNPDSRVTLEQHADLPLLGDYVISTEGLSTGDRDRFVFKFWEKGVVTREWEFFQSAPNSSDTVDGCSEVVLWESGTGVLAHFKGARVQGHAAWNRKGVLVGRMSSIRSSLYSQKLFDKSCVVLTPKNDDDLDAIYEFCCSPEFEIEIRKLDKKIGVATSVPLKVPFDLDRWNTIASQKRTNSATSFSSKDPTQWYFDGNPRRAHNPLQVAAAGLLGFSWPLQTGINFPDCTNKGSSILKSFVDEDGIVCLSSVRGERPAHERLLRLLQAAWGDEWSDGVLVKLLADTGGINLEEWLRNQFFEEHCKLFQHRPFIWHIWDGRKRDGFHALVNYHKLAEGDGKGRRLLESLTYSYLGDWIARQQDGVKRGEGGAEDRLAAALELQKRLVAILEGEPPFDIFVRWKPIEEQPIGWEPDINDGVRLNIRPFMAQDLPGGKKGAGILRAKPNIHWKKDRGKEPSRDQAQFPWFWKDGKSTGERVNDVHFTNAEKRTAREQEGA